VGISTLGKYYFKPRIGPVRLYATGGYVVRYLSGFDISIHTLGVEPVNGKPIDFTFHTSSSQYYVRDNPRADSWPVEARDFMSAVLQ